MGVASDETVQRPGLRTQAVRNSCRFELYKPSFRGSVHRALASSGISEQGHHCYVSGSFCSRQSIE